MEKGTVLYLALEDTEKRLQERLFRMFGTESAESLHFTILAKQLGISEHQLSYITHSNSGEGLLFYGNTTIPFVDRFPRGEIYDLLTTRPEDMAHERKDE